MDTQSSHYTKIPLVLLNVQPAQAMSSSHYSIIPFKALNSKAPASVQYCDRCNNIQASVFCIDCNKPYCSECYQEVHQRGRWAKHVVNPLNDSDEQQATSSRPFFSGNKMEKWACPVCTLENEGTAEKCAACETPREAKRRSFFIPKQKNPPPSSTTPMYIPPPRSQPQSVQEIPKSSPIEIPFSSSPPQNSPSDLGSSPTSPTSRWMRPSVLRPSQSNREVSTVINPPVSINMTGEKTKLENLKRAHKEKGLSIINTAALNLLSQGVFLRDPGASEEVLYYRLTEDKTALEYCAVPQTAVFEKKSTPPLNNPQKMLLANVENVKQGDARAIFLYLKGEAKTLIADNEHEQSFIVQGLRHLKGLDLDSKEVQELLDSIVEALSLNDLYAPPPLPTKPNNFNFVKPL